MMQDDGERGGKGAGEEGPEEPTRGKGETRKKSINKTHQPKDITLGIFTYFSQGVRKTNSEILKCIKMKK